MAENTTMTIEQMTEIMQSYRLLCEDKDKEIRYLRRQISKAVLESEKDRIRRLRDLIE